MISIYLILLLIILIAGGCFAYKVYRNGWGLSGMLATVAKVEEEFVVLEVGPNRTKMPFKKWAIASVEEKKENK